MGEHHWLRLDEILLILRRRGWLICLAALGGGAVFALIASTLPRLYRSEAEIVVRAEASVVPDPERAFNAAAINEAVVTTEKQVLSADGLLSRVAQNVSFPPGLDPPVSASARLANFLQRVLPAQLIADWRLGPLLKDLAGPDTPEALAERRLRAIEQAVRLTSDKGSSVINVSATTRDPQFSAAIVNTLAQTYMVDRLAAQSSVARHAEAALRQRLEQTKTEIAEAEERVANLLQQPALLEETQVPGAQRDLSLLSSRLAAARSDLAARLAAESELQKLLKAAQGDPERLVEALDQGGQTTSYLRERYYERQGELAELEARYGPDHPSVLNLGRQIQKLRAGLRTEAQRLLHKQQAELAAAEGTVAALANQYSNLERRGSQRSAASLVLTRERDKLDSLRGIAAKINDQILALVAQPLDPNARIISTGLVPLRPVFPNLPLFMLSGAALAALFVVLWSLWRTYANSLRLSPVEGAQYLTGPFIGALPRVSRRLLAPKYLFDGSRGKMAGSLAATFHGIALHVEDLMARQGAKLLTVTSGRPNEGKTTVASILAATLAGFGKRVLLLNCDAYSPLSETLTRKTGNWQIEPDAQPSIVAHDPTGLDVLELADKLAQAPLRYLRSSDFRALLERARADYDVVLCDTPPVLAVPDAVVVARNCDGVLVVAEHERMAERAGAEEIARRVALSGKPILGIIVTKAAGQDADFASYTGYANWRAA